MHYFGLILALAGLAGILIFSLFRPPHHDEIKGFNMRDPNVRLAVKINNKWILTSLVIMIMGIILSFFK